MHLQFTTILTLFLLGHVYYIPYPNAAITEYTRKRLQMTTRFTYDKSSTLYWSAHQCLSLPSHQQSMLVTNATSYSPLSGSHCLPPMPPLPSASLTVHQCYLSLVARLTGHHCYLSLLSHWLALLATTVTSHSPPIGYQCWPRIIPLTPLPSAIKAGHQFYLSLPSHRISLLATTTTCNTQVVTVCVLS